MPIYNKSQLDNIAALNYGIRAEAAAGLILNVATTKFTVAGGNVCLTGFYGEIMVPIPAGAVTLLATHTPTTGTATVIATASVDIAGYVAGRCCWLPAFGGALTFGATGYARMDVGPRYILRPGALSVTGSISPATGTIRWFMFYVPVDAGAYVTGS